MDHIQLNNQSYPVYNIKAVSRMVGLQPVTIRAWERRYGMPSPRRGSQGYRLYSEKDLHTLRWLKAQLDSGLSISRAVAYLASLNEQGEDPLQSPQVFNPPSHERSLSDFCALFLDSIKNLQETAAFGVINQTLEKYPLDRLFTGVLQPAMVEIGEAWHRKEIPIAVEHFGTQIVLQFLMGRLTAAAHPTRPGSMVAACAPGEDHQLGILMLVVMLKERGWDVRYLGPDLKLERLYDATQPIQPHMFLFSATRPETAESLHELAETIEDFPKPYPMIVLGGQAFTGFRLPNNLPAVYMDSDLNTSLSMIEFLLTKSRTEGRQA